MHEKAQQCSEHAHHVERQQHAPVQRRPSPEEQDAAHE